MRPGEGAYDSNVKGPSELKLSITISTSKTVLDLKEAIAAKSDVEKDRQRLIYSGTFAFCTCIRLPVGLGDLPLPVCAPTDNQARC